MKNVDREREREADISTFIWISSGIFDFALLLRPVSVFFGWKFFWSDDMTKIVINGEKCVHMQKTILCGYFSICLNKRRNEQRYSPNIK